MSLPWFPFYADAYTGDTGHLTCEEHGAYLQLMIAYYRSEKPLPGTDRALAALVKLPMERWLECKATLEPFFRSEGGFWHHDRIEAEMAERYAKHTLAVDKAKHAATAAVAARAARAAAKDATKPPPRSPTAHLEPTTSTTTTTLPPKGGVEEAPPPKAALQDLGKEITREFQPDADTLEYCVMLSPNDIAAQVPKFVNHHLEKGSLSNDWQASFRKWLDREVTYREKNAPKPEKAPPRVEVNATPDYAAWCKMWLKLRRWPRDCGGEPGMLSCLVPKSILLAHGIDPETGDKIKDHVG